MHWTREDLLSLDHVERQRWLQEIVYLEEAQWSQGMEGMQ